MHPTLLFIIFVQITQYIIAQNYSIIASQKWYSGRNVTPLENLEVALNSFIFITKKISYK